MSGSPLSTKELEGVAEIRNVLKNKIPVNLDTNFNLLRWWRGYGGNLEEMNNKFLLYVENRKVMGYDKEDFVETFYEMPKVKKITPFFATSRLGNKAITKDNGIVFVESGLFDKEVIKVVKTGEYLEVFFGFCELLLQLILRQEKESAKPAHAICIFDMKGVYISRHLNPSNACNKFFKIRANIWQDFFPEMLQKILIVNPPTFFSILWSCLRRLLSEKSQKIVSIIYNHRELTSLLDREVLPVAYGGDLKDESGWGPLNNCCNVRKEITFYDYYQSGTIWKEMGISRPIIVEMDIEMGQKFFVAQLIEFSNTTIAWHFTANSEVEFAIVKREGQNQCSKLVWPRLRLVKTKLPEEGSLLCTEPGHYYLEFYNPSHYFWLTLNYGVTAIVPSNHFTQNSQRGRALTSAF